MLIDTHCHIHEASYPLALEEVLASAQAAGVSKMICVGTNAESSERALKAATEHEILFAAIGVHPHESKDGVEVIATMARQADANLVAIGEIGLDYYYNHSPRPVQITALEQQLQVAVDHHLPVIFHVREAFDDFWPIVDNFAQLRGVLHSFTDSAENAQKAMSRGFYIGVNGISTFTKVPAQQAMYQHIPLDYLVLETDAPFLTPAPYRGKVNEPGRVREVAQFHAAIRNLSLGEIAMRTSQNATALFGI